MQQNTTNIKSTMPDNSRGGTMHTVTVVNKAFTENERTNLKPYLIQCSMDCAKAWRKLVKARNEVSQLFAAKRLADNMIFASIVDHYSKASKAGGFSEEDYWQKVENIVRDDHARGFLGLTVRIPGSKQVLKKLIIDPSFKNNLFKVFVTDRFQDVSLMKYTIAQTVFQVLKNMPNIPGDFKSDMASLTLKLNGSKETTVMPEDTMGRSYSITEIDDSGKEYRVIVTSHGILAENTYQRHAPWVKDTIEECFGLGGDYEVTLTLDRKTQQDEKYSRLCQIQVLPNIMHPVFENQSGNQKYLFMESSYTICSNSEWSGDMRSKSSAPLLSQGHRQSTAVRLKEARTPLHGITENDFMLRIFKIQMGTMKLYAHRHYLKGMDLRQIKITPQAKTCNFKIYPIPGAHQIVITLSSMYTIDINTQGGNIKDEKWLVKTSYTIKDTYAYTYKDIFRGEDILISENKDIIDADSKEKREEGYITFSKIPSPLEDQISTAQLGTRMVTSCNNQQDMVMQGKSTKQLKSALKKQSQSTGRNVVKSYTADNHAQHNLGTPYKMSHHHHHPNQHPYMHQPMMPHTPPPAHPLPLALQPPGGPTMMMMMPYQTPPPPLLARPRLGMLMPTTMMVPVAPPRYPVMLGESVSEAPAPARQLKQNQSKAEREIASLRKDLEILNGKMKQASKDKARQDRFSDPVKNNQALAEKVSQFSLPTRKQAYLDISKIRLKPKTANDRDTNNKEMHEKAIRFWTHTWDPMAAEIKRQFTRYPGKVPVDWSVHDFVKYLGRDNKDDGKGVSKKQPGKMSDDKDVNDKTLKTVLDDNTQHIQAGEPVEDMVVAPPVTIRTEVPVPAEIVAQGSSLLGQGTLQPPQLESIPEHEHVNADDEDDDNNNSGDPAPCNSQQQPEQNQQHWASKVWPGKSTSTSAPFITTTKQAALVPGLDRQAVRKPCLSIEESRKVLADANLLGKQSCSAVLLRSVISV